VLLIIALGAILFYPVVTLNGYPAAGTYKNLAIQNGPDPSIIGVNGTDGLTHWYMYCTSGPINDNDKSSRGVYNTHLMTILQSTDLVNWTYVSDVFAKAPRWVGSSNLWAPDIQFFNGKYYLYYTAANAGAHGNKGSGGAIGVATSSSPVGPWTDSGGAVVEAQSGRWVYDPFVVLDDYGPAPTGQRYLFYGSFTGGLFARKLSADGLHTDRTTEVAIAVPDRYEATYIRKHDGAYYLFVSAANCCNDDLTGYSVFVGRSANLLGPYTDREGVSLRDSRVGGSPVISMNGNRYVGPGHNAAFTDYAGQDWFVYAAVNRLDPFFVGGNLTKRAPMLDPLDWSNGWPTVRGGLWASETVSNRPAAQPGQPNTYSPTYAVPDMPGTPIAELSDEFDGTRSNWSWAGGRVPAAGTYGLTPNGTFSFAVQARDLYEDRNDASVYIEPTPAGDFVVETRMYLPVPGDFSNHNYVQAGLVIYGDDNNYIKLVHSAINGTRQTEYAKEIPTGQRYGNTFIGPPGDWTYLRIVRRTNPGNGEEDYTAYTTVQTDANGQPANWVRGGTWTHNLGANAKIGLVSMSGSGYTAQFDYVHVSTVQP
jgi:arabinan endo-1,5-alpha-L-arabinosidase